MGANPLGDDAGWVLGPVAMVAFIASSAERLPLGQRKWCYVD